MKIEVLDACSGDAILIRYKDTNNINRNILIDGGIGRTYPRVLKPKLKEIITDGENIDLLVITHTDNDHIGGIIKFFEDTSLDKSIVKNILFNTGKEMSEKLQKEIEFNDIILANKSLETNISQGITLQSYIERFKINKLKLAEVGQVIDEIDGVKLKILTPNFDTIKKIEQEWSEEEKNLLTSGYDNDYKKSIEELVKIDFIEDNSIYNKSSISFILEIKKKKYLFLGDAWASDVVNGLKEFGYSNENKIEIELVKLSHHGSKKNTSDELLDILECKRYIVSSKENKLHNNPTKEALSRIIMKKRNAEIYFNYDIANKIFNNDEKEKYAFKVEFKSVFLEEI